MRVVAVVPVHNEAPTVAAVLDAAAAVSDAVLVVDDGSRDGSADAVARWCAGRPDAAWLSLGTNRGKAVALRAAFLSALAWADAGALDGGDALVTLDADGQHPPERIPALAARVGPGGADLAIARRDMAGYPRHKRLGNRLLSGWGRLWGGFPFADLECGMRALRISALRALLPYYSGRRYSGEHEIGVIAARLGLAIDDSLPIAGGAYVPGARPRDAAAILVYGAAAALRAALGTPARPGPEPAAPPAPPLSLARRGAA